MPGRTPAEAFGAFSAPLASSLACVAACKLTHSSGGQREVGPVHHLLGNAGDPIVVGGPAKLRLILRMKYQIIKDEALEGGRYKIRTRAYSYTMADESGVGILSYHWHPEGTSHVDSPHAHVGITQLRQDAVLSAKHHLPTGRISIEQVVRALIAEHGVPAKVADWDTRLALADGVFRLYSSWQ